MLKPGPQTWAKLGVSAVLVATTWIAFAPSLDNGFVNSDDQLNFLDNHEYRGLGWEQVRSAFTRPRLGVYQPLGSLALSVQYAMFGMDPRGYHLASLLMHCGNAAMLFLVAASIAGRVTGPLTNRSLMGCGVAAALFAAHPQRTEPVAWATAQLYLVGGGFSLLSLLCYLKAHPDGGPSRGDWLGASYAAALASMLSMPGAVSLPIAFLIADRAILKRRDLVEKAPYFAMAAVVTVLAIWAKGHDRMLVEPGRDGVWAKLAQVCYGIAFYASQTLVPTRIAGYYPRPEGGNFASPFYGGVVALVAVGGLAIAANRKRWPWAVASSLCFLVLLLPHLGLIRVGNTVAADRYCYAASMVPAVLAAIGICRLRGANRQVAALVLGAAAVVLLAPVSRGVSRTWHDSESLWRQAGRMAPWSSDVHLGIGSSLGDPGRLREAIAEYDKALEIRPGWPKALVSKGAVLASLGRFEAAMECDRQALATWPDFHTAHLNLGLALAALGRPSEAEQAYRRVLKLAPNHPEAHQKLGVLLLAQNRIEDAAAQFRATLKFVPWHAEALANLGIVRAFQGRHAEAVPLFRKSLETDPRNPCTRTNLGISLAQVGRCEESEAELSGVVQEDPENLPARTALGAVMAQNGRGDAAIAEFQEVLRRDPANGQAGALLSRIIEGRSARR